ncbi:hypothetical protein [Rhodohalobacter mucosus]|uniref:Yip1 domain-containing protein n=1 Tax=Rhodohalobacter mucosus TaxID=2079485 RepID=A0A316TNW5_9BACT|nr:hypothetical protein [Rhodohalobacter mucosus]PWN06090.1 hypothetical protein DDZ15_09550 [Rhodohalobacter mucosus]
MKNLRLYLPTLKELWSAPRNVIDSFLHAEADQPRSFTHPFAFVLISAAFILLVMNVIPVDYSFDPAGIQTGPGDEPVNEQIAAITEWIEVSNVWAFTRFLPLSAALFLIPMLSLGGLFFLRESVSGFYENLILNTYTVGASIPVLALLVPAWMLSGLPVSDPMMSSTLPAVALALPMLHLYRQYLRPSDFLGWVRLISSYATGYILFAVLSGFAAGLIGYLAFAIHRILELSGSF